MAQRIHVKGTFYHPMYRASVLGKLGRVEDAAPYIEELLEVKPDFLKRPREIIRLFFVLDEHVEIIWDGLCKAGIENESYLKL